MHQALFRQRLDPREDLIASIAGPAHDRLGSALGEPTHEDGEAMEEAVPLTEDVGDDPIWVYSALENDDGLPSGNYTVEVYHDGDLVGEQDFSVAAE